MNIIKSKILTGAVMLLLSAIIGQSIYYGIANRKTQRKINELYDMQTDRIEQIKAEHKIKEDSLTVLLEDKQNRIKNLEYSLYKSVKNAEINNKKYEQLKKQARNISDADSLSGILSNRYQKGQR